MESPTTGSGWTSLRKSAKMIAPGSARQAWYSLILYQLPRGVGYVIEKRSGPKGSKGVNEMWFRHSFEEADLKFNAIIRRKLGQSGPRKYVQVSDIDSAPDQSDLWP